MFPAPSLIVPTLEDFQWSYNGLKMGANTPYGILSVEGISMADIRNGDGDWPRDHGQALGLDLLGGQDVILDLWVKSDGTSLQHAQLALAAATRVQPSEETPLWFKLPFVTTMCLMTRPRKRPRKIDSDYASGQIDKPELTLHATDPRFYEHGRENTINLGPLSGGKVTAGKLVVTNGNMEMRPIVIFAGKLWNPAITSKSITGLPTLTISPPPITIEGGITEKSKIVNELASTGNIAVGGPVTGPSLVLEATLKSKSNLVTLKTATTVLAVGREVTGYKIPAGTTIAKVISGTEIELSAATETFTPETTTVSISFPYIKAGVTVAKILGAKEIELSAVVEGTGTTKFSKQKVAFTFSLATADQLLIDLGTPHRVVYYPGGIGANKPENKMEWLNQATSVWWDLLPENNELSFISSDIEETGGTATLQWAPAWML